MGLGEAVVPLQLLEQAQMVVELPEQPAEQVLLELPEQQPAEQVLLELPEQPALVQVLPEQELAQRVQELQQQPVQQVLLGRVEEPEQPSLQAALLQYYSFVELLV